MRESLPKPWRTALNWKQHVDRFFYRSKKIRQERSQTNSSLVDLDLLAWSQYFLPDHFRLPPSQMHCWLASQLDAMSRPSPIDSITKPPRRTAADAQTSQGPMTNDKGPSDGTKLNVVGPRGSAKSTVATLAFILREALHGREPYIWIVSDTKHQAAAHLENVKAELLENHRLQTAYPNATGMGPVWRAGAAMLRNKVLIEAFGAGQRIRGRRLRHHRPTLIVCDDLQNDGHIQSATARDHSHAWFHGMLLKAGTKTTTVLILGTALHRECLVMELHRTPGWISQVFRAIQRWPNQMPLWHAWEQIYCDIDRPDARLQARAFYDVHRREMDAGAELLWPEQEDLYTLMCMRGKRQHRLRTRKAKYAGQS